MWKVSLYIIFHFVYNFLLYLNSLRFEEAAESYTHILTADTDKIIINLKGGPISNIDGPLEVVQKFIAEQVIRYFCLKIKLLS